MEQDIIITPEVEEQSIEVTAEQGVFPEGTIDINSNGIVDVSSYANANVDVSVNLQNKKVDITENGTTTITADSGYSGLNEAEVNVNVPAPKYKPRFILFSNYTGNSLDYEIANLDTSLITNMQNMFSYCSSVVSFNCSHFDTSNATNMSSMFNGCRFTTSIDVSNFDTSNVENFSNMFNGCFNWRTEVDLDLSSFTLDKARWIGSMFSGCTMLRTLDISNMDFSNITSNFGYMFTNCGTGTSTRLTKVYVKDANAQNWVLTANNGHPSTWSTANVVIKN